MYGPLHALNDPLIKVITMSLNKELTITIFRPKLGCSYHLCRFFSSL